MVHLTTESSAIVVVGRTASRGTRGRRLFRSQR